MRATIFLSILLFVSNLLHGQTRTIYGRVVYEDLLPVPYARIQTSDKLIETKADIDGIFNISISQNTKSLLFTWIGLEPATIKLNDDCDTVEVVMMNFGYDEFASSRKIDKERLKRFNKLPELHLQAYKKGIFTKESVCYSREFEPDKPYLDSIGKVMAEKVKQNKLIFERLGIGDTIRIPFYRYNGADTTRLTSYSISSEAKDCNCIIKCIVADKNKHRGGYNLVCRVTDSSKCKSPSVFGNVLMKVGEVFTYNIKYLKILNE